MLKPRLIFILLIALFFALCAYYVNSLPIHHSGSIASEMKRQVLLDSATASILAGFIAGAAGVGVAFPLDTLKTKSQVLGAAQVSDNISGGAVAIETGDVVNKMNMFELIGLIYKLEGISGFYGGVKGMMVGQGAFVLFFSCTSYQFQQSTSTISHISQPPFSYHKKCGLFSQHICIELSRSTLCDICCCCPLDRSELFGLCDQFFRYTD